MPDLNEIASALELEENGGDPHRLADAAIAAAEIINERQAGTR